MAEFGDIQYPYSNRPDAGSSTEPDVQQDDATLNALYSTGNKDFHVYPQELHAQDHTGHFIMFQAFTVEGVSLDDVIEAVQGAAEQAGAAAGVVKDGVEEAIGVGSTDEENQTSVGGLISRGVENIFHNDLAAEEIKQIEDLDRKNTLTNRLQSQSLSSLGFNDTRPDIEGQRKTLEETIALYMPNNLTASYSFDYSMENDLLASGIRSILDFTRAGKDVSADQALSTANKIKNVVVDTAVNMGAGSMNLFGQDIGGTISSVTRTVKNPHLEFLFKQVGQRAFSYTFNFFPRNQSELDETHAIINAFKKHAHPTYDPTSIVVKMPSEFEIIFYSGGVENKYINRVLPCVLTSVEVNYSPNGQAVFFEAKDAEKGQSPTQIDLTLSFAEVGLLHRDHIEKGGF